MASVDRNVFNPLTKMTDVHAGPPQDQLFNGVYVFGIDAFPAFALQSPMAGQHVDGASGRGLNEGRGVVGEGGDKGPGVVGIAGGAIPRPDPAIPRGLSEAPFPGRGFLAGVVGLGADPATAGREGSSTPVGVFGFANNVGVFGRSRTTGVFGDAKAGQYGVEGVGTQAGVYGHVDFGNPNADGAGVMGAAAMDLRNPGVYVGRAGVFVGPVEVTGDLTVLGNQVAWGTKSAAAKHDDGTHRLLYCVESPESLFEDFGEARLAKGTATVKLDRDFAGVADTRHYHVFLTPYGDSNGLYVTNRTRNSFQVREQGGGKSSLTFSYRVVAKRSNVTVKRFQKVRPPKQPSLGAERPDVDSTWSAAGAGRSAKRKRPAR